MFKQSSDVFPGQKMRYEQDNEGQNGKRGLKCQLLPSSPSLHPTDNIENTVALTYPSCTLLLQWFGGKWGTRVRMDCGVWFLN